MKRNNKERQAAKTAYLRKTTVFDPYWETVWHLLVARKFPLGSRTFEEWRDYHIKQKVSPEQVMDYSWHYGTQSYWGQLAQVGVRNLSEWLDAVGLEGKQFYGNDFAKPVMEDIIRWKSEGYTASQIRAWRSIGLTPEEVEDKSKPVILIVG